MPLAHFRRWPKQQVREYSDSLRVLAPLRLRRNIPTASAPRTGMSQTAVLETSVP